MPAYINSVIIEEFWPNNKLKRRKWNDGQDAFYNERGLWHRTDGPAIIGADGIIQFWVNGEPVNVASTEELIIKLLLE